VSLDALHAELKDNVHELLGKRTGESSLKVTKSLALTANALMLSNAFRRLFSLESTVQVPMNLSPDVLHAELKQLASQLGLQCAFDQWKVRYLSL